ncbi:MAG TPA: helix-turn-helix domain-containing protein [Candidatus Ventrousia excrementavium]|uniref:Helix-turn-helix domain-containing protein n=1 Tax=Candidatus Ventrousia excrementavium TaxID=2840961 RepID=A0A9D1IUX6_9CLOT|nr:helix-turn-helix domain-containing protein [Candidatus Ventrousia excrementavium]
MAARLFQSILLEIKSKVSFMLGVVDAAGNIVSCTELRFIGENIEAASEFFAAGVEEGEFGGYCFNLLSGYENGSEYAVFASQKGEGAAMVCAVTAVAISNSQSLYDEKHDKVTFIKKILLDNILPGDIYIKSREMNFSSDMRRVVYLVRMNERQDAAVVEVLQRLFPDRQKDFAVTINENEVVLVKEIKTPDSKEIARIAKLIDTTLTEELQLEHVIGVGAVANQLKDVARSFKEAQIAVDIGRVFDEDLTVMNFENLGIGRLIYQLPTTLCEMFLSEVFKKGSIESLDEETLFTIQKFFENNLNVSETSRKLFVHRNTLVYRLEKIKKITGLDLREFDNAIVLKVALMVKKYLKSRESFS